MPTGIIVLGIRSGTSALMGMLNIMGADVGTKLLAPAPDNPKGFYELEDLVKINQQIVDWKEPQLVDPAAVNSAQKIRITGILKQFKHSKLFAIKDPRIISLRLVYQEIFQELGYDLKVIAITRSTSEIAQSLFKHHSLDLDSCFMIASQYKRLMTAPFCLTYTELLTNTIHIARLLKTWIPEFKAINTELQIELQKFIDPRLRHYND